MSPTSRRTPFTCSRRAPPIPQPYFAAAPDLQHPARPAFTQPNDIAIARDGTIYASDPNFGAGKGRIWRITRDANGKAVGVIMTSTRQQGITNGLDLSPDNKTLYVSKSKFGQRPASLWAYRIDGTALVADPTPLHAFTEAATPTACGSIPMAGFSWRGPRPKRCSSWCRRARRAPRRRP